MINPFTFTYSLYSFSVSIVSPDACSLTLAVGHVNDAPAYVRLHATGLTMLAVKEYRVYTHTNTNTQKWPVLPSTGCFKSPVHSLSFERIYLEYYYRHNGKIKIYNRFGYGKSIALGFSSISIVILKKYRVLQKSCPPFEL